MPSANWDSSKAINGYFEYKVQQEKARKPIKTSSLSMHGNSDHRYWLGKAISAHWQLNAAQINAIFPD